MDETYIKVRGQWKYQYRAVDKAGRHRRLPAHRQARQAAALRFLHRAIDNNGAPQKVTSDCRGSNTAALEAYNIKVESKTEIRQRKYLNNLVEQDPRFVKQRRALRSASKRSAQHTLRLWA